MSRIVSKEQYQERSVLAWEGKRIPIDKFPTGKNFKFPGGDFTKLFAAWLYWVVADLCSHIGVKRKCTLKVNTILEEFSLKYADMVLLKEVEPIHFSISKMKGGKRVFYDFWLRYELLFFPEEKYHPLGNFLIERVEEGKSGKYYSRSIEGMFPYTLHPP